MTSRSRRMVFALAPASRRVQNFPARRASGCLTFFRTCEAGRIRAIFGGGWRVSTTPGEAFVAKKSDGGAAAVKSSSVVLFPQQPALQLIYDTAPIGLACLSPDCRYLQINQRLTEICGISVEDHLGRSVRDCVPALAGAVEDIVRSIMETGEPVTGIEVAGQRADQPDERFWITYWHPLRNPSGEIVGINVAAEEITERKRAEAALKASEKEIRSLADSIPQLAWTADANGWIYWYNQRWHDYTGTTLEEMEGWG